MIEPLPFTIFIKDMSNDLDRNVKMKHSADDTLMYTNVKFVSDQVNLKEQFSRIYIWCREGQMEINKAKTVNKSASPEVKPARLPLCIIFDEVLLSSVREHKYLGSSLGM